MRAVNKMQMTPKHCCWPWLHVAAIVTVNRFKTHKMPY